MKPAMEFERQPGRRFSAEAWVEMKIDKDFSQGHSIEAIKPILQMQSRFSQKKFLYSPKPKMINPISLPFAK
jgi:hypothetical protein